MDVASEVLEMEDELWRADREGDGSYYERVLAVDAIAVSPYGVATKTEVVPLINSNQNPYVATELLRSPSGTADRGHRDRHLPGRYHRHGRRNRGEADRAGYERLCAAKENAGVRCSTSRPRLIAGSALEWPIDFGLDHCVRATRRSISRDTPGPLTDFGDS